MDMNNDSKKMTGDTISGVPAEGENVDLFDMADQAEDVPSTGDVEDADDGLTVDLFELAAANDEPLYTPAPEDIFCIEEPEKDDGSYPDGFDDSEEYFHDSDEFPGRDFSGAFVSGDSGHSDADAVVASQSLEDDISGDDENVYSQASDDNGDSSEDDVGEYSDDEDEEDFSDDEDEEEYSDDEDEEEYSDDEGEEDFSDDEGEEEYSDDEDEEEYSDNEDDEEYPDDEDEEEYPDDEGEEDFSDDEDEEEYSDDEDEEEYSDDEDDEEYSDDEDDEEYSDDEDDEEYSDDAGVYMEEKEVAFFGNCEGKYFEDEEDDEYSDESHSEYVEPDDDYTFEGDDDEEDEEEAEGEFSVISSDDVSYIPAGDEEDIFAKEAVEAASETLEVPETDDSVDLFVLANNANDLPQHENHSALYYWAKRKTAGGWVKFGLKCTAALLLIFVVAGVLYFNGLLNLIDYKAADDFEIYDNISDTDYREDDDIIYSSPESYIETTTIEGFTESMIDIPKKDVLNILLIGTDVRGGTYDERGNTDSMILISVNTRDKNIKLTSFMRDMYVFIPNRQWARLNVAYAYGGPQLLFDTLKQNFNVDVDLYVRVNFMYFRKIVNHVGGVDIELTEAEAKYMNDTSEKYKTKHVEPGMQHLDGAQALSYARCRKIDSDFNRTKRQRTVILALVKKIKHSSPGELNSLLNVFLPMIQTNMSKMQILGLMVDGTSYLNNEIETMNVPIKNSWRSEMINKRSVICPNFELNKTAIVAHIYSTYHLDVEQTKYQRFSIPNA